MNLFLFPLTTLLFLLMSPLPCTISTNAAGRIYLKRKAADPQVISTKSGLMYKVISSSSSSTSLNKDEGDNPTPTLASTYVVHYKGSIGHNGFVFDSSYKRRKPNRFQPKHLIKGWKEAMLMMSPGDKWEIYLPSELAYGERGFSKGKITPGDALTFVVEVISIEAESSNAFLQLLNHDMFSNSFIDIKLYHLIIFIIAALIHFVDKSNFLSPPPQFERVAFVSHILLETEEECDKIMEQLNSKDNKTSFSELAKMFSCCDSSESGGSLGSFSPNEGFSEEFEQVLFDSEIGSYSKIASKFGFHIAVVTKREMQEIRKIDENGEATTEENGDVERKQMDQQQMKEKDI